MDFGFPGAEHVLAAAGTCVLISWFPAANQWREHYLVCWFGRGSKMSSRFLLLQTRLTVPYEIQISWSWGEEQMCKTVIT